MMSNSVSRKAQRRRHVASAALLCASMLACMPPALAQEVSQAEKLLFQSNHLRNLTGPQALRYRYVHNEKDGAGFSDVVQVDVGARNSDGGIAVTAKFLSGERQVALPPLSSAEGNPALLGFLERDIAEMKRLTGGSTNYFRKRIRIALAEAASVEPVSLAYDGRQVQGRKIAIQPYLNDPMREKMQKYVGKNYVFLLSDEIPGAVYELKSTVPGEPKASAAQVEETMTLAGASGGP